jgi:CDK inhibitor PHO81
VNIITSFEGVTLEVGGDVETYWKSMAMPVVSMPQPSLSRWSHRSSLIGSAHTSPSVSSANNLGGQAALTISSLHGSYVFAVVQVTRDLQPVVYSEWLLQGTDYDLGVSDVTLVQFEALSRRLGRNINSEDSAAVKDWSSILSHCMISLADLLKVHAKVVQLIVRLLTAISDFTHQCQH